jgi:clan AA aspartic protease (TIGR02281 family)
MRHFQLIAATLLTLTVSPCIADDTNIPLREVDGATLYVAGQIEGYGRTEFLLDTGASYLAINKRMLKTLERNGHARYLRNLAGTMADGRRQSIPIYRISSIVIGEDCQLRDVEAAVLPGGTRNILGMSALRRTAPFTLSMDPMQLSLSGCEKPQA